MRGRAAPRCPHCGSKRVVPVVYGVPDDAMIAAVEEGRAVLAGSCPDGSDPAWRCRRCAADWVPMANAGLPQP